MSRVTKGMFKDFIMRGVGAGVSEKDIDVLFKTHESLVNKEILTRFDLLDLLKTPYSEAKSKGSISSQMRVKNPFAVS
jgi:hypothetical protein